MKYFIDTEFHERGPNHPIEPISIGIVAEDGREFYAVNRSFDWSTASEWLRENVRPHLPLREGGATFAHIEWFPELIREFIGDDPSPEFWGYYCDYDWVVFCQIFGTMMDLPKGFPMYCRDLRQWLDDEALHHVEQDDDAPHNALQDARWIRDTLLEHRRKQWGDA